MSTKLDDPEVENPNPAPAEGRDTPEEPLVATVPKFQINDDGTFGEGWSSSNVVDDDIKGAKWMGNIKDIRSLIRTTHNAQKMIGANPADVIIKPGKDAPPEKWAEYHQKIGVPDSPDAYNEVLKDFQVPEGVKFDAEKQAAFAKRAQEELKLTPQQFQGLYHWYAQEQADINANTPSLEQLTKTAISNTEKSLKEDALFGGDRFDESMSFARAAYKEILTEHKIDGDSQEAIDFQNAMRANPLIMKTLAHFGKNFGEHKYVAGERESNAGLTPASLESRKQEIMKQQQGLKAHSAEFKALDAELNKLSELSVKMKQQK